MGIAMHLAIPEGKNRVEWAIKIYDVLSQLKVTMATPTLANARKPKAQLASCFIDVVADSLKGIYKSLDSFAQISKQGGRLGLYFARSALPAVISGDFRAPRAVCCAGSGWSMIPR